MGRPITHDLKDQKIGRLKINSYQGGGKWLCSCDCGNEKIILGSSIARGDTKSCGCLRKEVTAKRDKERSTHGMYKSREYKTWMSMKERCNNKNHSAFKSYGGRGIKVCDRWQSSFKNFYADMGNRPAGCSLDRINNDKGYFPENCRWSTSKQQQSNRRNNVFVLVNGKKVTAFEASKILDVPMSTLHAKIKRKEIQTVPME